MVDVYVVVHRSTWEGYDVSVERFDDYKRVVERLSRLLHANGQSVSEVFDFSEFAGVWPLSVVRRYLSAVVKEHNFVNDLAARGSAYGGHDKLTVQGSDAGSTNSAWLVFKFRERLFKLNGRRSGYNGYVQWDELSKLIEVESNEQAVAPVTVFSEKVAED